jgi:anthranilate synthase component 1
VENGTAIEQDLTVDDPLAFIDQFRRTLRVPRLDNLPRFHGGLVGYFGYDTIRYIEPRLGACPNPDDLDTPDILLMVSEELVVFDNLLGKLQIIVHASTADNNGYERAQQRLQELVEKLAGPYAPRSVPAKARLVDADFKSGFGQGDFEASVEQARRYIIDGDVMQVVLAQRSSVPFDASSLDVYRALRTLNPSPYMYFLDLDDFEIAGSSPEILVRVEDDDVTVRPIAGTRRRGRNPVEDRALEQELLHDPKELAEHLMLIDLGRNDIGRVCNTGSVRVTEKMIVERYSHVMHIVSNVSGRLREDMTPIDVLRATFPAGTLSGAPKVRAMEIIDELEIVKRGIYGGAIGYIGWTGNMDTAIAIRTAVIKDGVLYIQAGAGIVYDSVPGLEWKETLNKSRAVFRAAAMAAAGLELSAATGA